MRYKIIALYIAINKKIWNGWYTVVKKTKTCRMHFIKWNISFLTKDKTQNINYYDDASGWYLPTQILPSNYISTICVAIVLREELIFMKMVVCDNFFVVLHIKSYFNAKHGSYFFLTFLYLTQGRLREAFKNKKVWNFPYFSGVGGFEKVIFHIPYFGLC